LFALIIQLSSYALAFILSPLFVLSGSESLSLWGLLSDLIEVFLPKRITLSFFWFYSFIILILPFVLVEEFRNLITGKAVNTSYLTLALFLSILYFVMGFELFKIALNYVKRKGLVKLS